MKPEVKKGLYAIESFMTNRERGETSSCGFSIILNAEVANSFAQMKREDGGRFVEELRLTIVRNFSGWESAKYVEAPTFLENTWLLTSMKVPGTCACFFIDGGAHSIAADVKAGKQRRDVRYSPHNLDTPEQAATVLGVWLYWFNTILSASEFVQPFAL
jgi:hypothetical protein